VQVRLAWITAVDAERKTVDITDTDGPSEIAYDTLVYALGSAAADCGVPGVAEHAHNIAGKQSALRLRERLADLAAGGAVLGRAHRFVHIGQIHPSSTKERPS
jgi:NADH dehydrogenase